MASEAEIKQRFSQLEAWLDERSRRLWAAAESVVHGRGGISLVSRASGVSRRAIAAGVAELQNKPDSVRRTGLPIRRKGGGRKKTALKDPALLSDLEKLLEPMTRGDPQSPDHERRRMQTLSQDKETHLAAPQAHWTCKSVRNLAEELRAQGHKVSHMLVAELLHEQKYSLQANRKTKEGSSHPDRNAQFEHINADSPPLWGTQLEGGGVPEKRSACDFGRREKEGTGRGLQERRPRMASQGPGRTRPGP